MGPQTPHTKEEARWRRAIIGFGCVACHLDGFPEVPALQHHIVEFGRRIGHRYSLPLCQDHHVPDTRSGKVSIHPGRNPAFTAIYGTERELLASLEAKLGFDHAP